MTPGFKPFTMSLDNLVYFCVLWCFRLYWVLWDWIFCRKMVTSPRSKTVAHTYIPVSSLLFSFLLFQKLQEVTAIEFHPSALVLASGSKDCTVKLFDISKPSVKKAYRSIQVKYFSIQLKCSCFKTQVTGHESQWQATMPTDIGKLDYCLLALCAIPIHLLGQ